MLKLFHWFLFVLLIAGAVFITTTIVLNSPPPPPYFPPPHTQSPAVAAAAVTHHHKLELLNKQPPVFTSPRRSQVIKHFYSHPLAKLVSRKILQHTYRIYYQRTDHDTLFEFYNPQYEHYPALFALDDASALQLSNHYDEILPHLRTTMPRKMMDLVLNKAEFSKWLLENGFEDNVPKLFPTIPTTNEVYPLVCKVASGSTSSFGVYVARNQSHLRQIVSALQPTTTTGYLLQEYIPGSRERTIHVVAIHGRMVRMVCHERDIANAIVYQYISNPNKWRRTPPEIPNKDCHLKLFQQIIQRMQFNGIGNFDIKVHANQVKIFEFNPRVPGTVLRDARLMGEFFCAMQWNGNGVIGPQPNGGCVYTDGNYTLV